MVEPIRPQDATGIYQRQVESTGAGARATPGRRTASPDGGGRRADSVTLSERAQGLQRALTVVTGLPDVRNDRIAELRARLASGDYHVDADEIAQRMLEERVEDEGAS
jgi:negative regulator of flagellin synthesis FlgM